MKVRIFAALICTLSCDAFGACNLETKTDSMTDEVKRSVTCVNDAGYKLSFYRATDGTIMGNFSLPDRSLDVLGEPLPMYRVDKLTPVKITKGLPELGLVMAIAEPKWVNWVLFHGKGSADTGALRDIMNGANITFRYNLFTGGFKETTISLAGARNLIAEALGVPAEVDEDKAVEENALKAERKRNFALSKAYREAAYLTCKEKASKATKDCFGKVIECDDSLHPEKGKACLVEAGLLDANFEAQLD